MTYTFPKSPTKIATSSWQSFTPNTFNDAGLNRRIFDNGVIV